MEVYVWGYDICLTSKAIKHKSYSDIQSLLVSTHCQKDLLIDFKTGLPILTDWKVDSYDTIPIIVNRLTKIVYYKQINIMINAAGLAKVIIDMVVKYYVFQSQLLMIKAHYLPQSFDFYYATSLALSGSYPLHSICKRTARQRDKTVRQRLIFVLLSIRSKITGQGSCSQRNLYTTTLKIRLLVIYLLTSTPVIIPAFHLKINLTLT